MATKKEKRARLEEKRAVDLAETQRLNRIALEKDRAARKRQADAIAAKKKQKQMQEAARSAALAMGDVNQAAKKMQLELDGLGEYFEDHSESYYAQPGDVTKLGYLAAGS